MFVEQILSFNDLMKELKKPNDEKDLFNELELLKKENDKLKANQILIEIKPQKNLQR